MKQFQRAAESIIGHYTSRIDEELILFLSRQRSYKMYDMMRYFFGYNDENGNILQQHVGKRMRPGLMLLVADALECIQESMPAAISMELFHNFSLIHDDIEDNDELRRGRPTVWNIWGVNQAINTGDAQLLLSLEPLIVNFQKKEIALVLSDAYKQVIEGQHLDLLLAELPLSDERVTQKYYMDMITKKTAVLIAAALAVPALIADRPREEFDTLWQYGIAFGRSYQVADDIMSLWGTNEETGKLKGGDIVERKKTLPIIQFYSSLEPHLRTHLSKLYSEPTRISEEEMTEVLHWFQTVPDVKASLDRQLEHLKQEAGMHAKKLMLPHNKQRGLQFLTESIGK